MVPAPNCGIGYAASRAMATISRVSDDFAVLDGFEHPANRTSTAIPDSKRIVSPHALRGISIVPLPVAAIGRSIVGDAHPKDPNQLTAQLTLVQIALQLTAEGDRDRSGLLADHDDGRVGLLRQPERRPVPRAERARDARVGGQRKDARGR